MSHAADTFRPRDAELCTVAHKWRMTRAQAKKEAKRLERDLGAKMNIWLCVCGGWHIGKRKPRPRPY